MTYEPSYPPAQPMIPDPTIGAFCPYHGTVHPTDQHPFPPEPDEVYGDHRG